MIPNGNAWTTADLCDVASIEIGRTPSRAKPQYWGGRHKWLTISDFKNGECIWDTREKITDIGVRECGVHLHAPGTLVMSFKLTIGKLGFIQDAMATNEAIVALKPIRKMQLDPRYLFHFLNQFNFDGYVDRAAKGGTLNKAKLRGLKIRFPDAIERQREIAAMLDRVDGIRRKRDQALAHATDLVRSTFLEMFGDPIVNPKGFPLSPIRELGRVVTGNTPPRDDPTNYGPGIEWIKSDNINSPLCYVTKADEMLTEKGRRIGRTVPTNSTLVTCIAGSPNSIGNAAMTDREIAFNQQINAVVPYPGIDPFFLYGHFLVGKRLVQNASTNSMKGMVSKGKFQEIKFVNPDASEQSKFGHIFRNILSAAEKLRVGRRYSEQLFQSLSQKSFNGEL